jgi:L-ribulokinase
MAHLSGTSYRPRPENREAYEILYGEYVRLHDLFGRGGDDVMRRLKRLQIEALATSSVPA